MVTRFGEQYRGQRLWIGLGCQRGVAQTAVAAAIRQVCATHGLDEAQIAGIATLESKSTEAGLLDLCRKRQWVLRYFSAEQLRAVTVPHPAIRVMAAVATPSVAEAAAILAAGAPLCVGKQVIRQAGEPSMTIAVAQSPPEA